MTHNIYVVADDFGYSDKVSLEIERLLDMGLIHTTSVMVNAPNYYLPIKHLSKLRLHLNLTEFTPLTDVELLRKFDLVNENGHLTPGNLNVKIWSFFRIYLLYKEAIAQFEKASNDGIPMVEFDSHQHVHTKFFFMPLLFILKYRYKLISIRTTRTNCSGIKKVLKNLWLSYVKQFIGFKSFDVFLSFSEYFETNKMSGHVYEIMMHPGHELFEEENSTFEKYISSEENYHEWKSKMLKLHRN